MLNEYLPGSRQSRRPFPLAARPAAAYTATVTAMMDLDQTRLAAAAERALVAARAAGEAALEWFREGGATRASISYKGGHSPVSEADHAADAVLREALAGPEGFGWLSEESAAAHAPARADAPFWLVDPIDGTRAFIAGDPRWAVSVALVSAGRPLVAVLHAPALGDTYVATAGRGARLNDAPLRIGESAGPRRVAGPKALLDRYLARMTDAEPVAKIPSLALRIAGVASGALAVALAGTGANGWDVAAVDLVLAEAGGMLTDEHGAPPAYRPDARAFGPLVAASAALHDDARRRLTETLLAHPAVGRT